jgi:hypothetical protein
MFLHLHSTETLQVFTFYCVYIFVIFETFERTQKANILEILLRERDDNTSENSDKFRENFIFQTFKSIFHLSFVYMTENEKFYYFFGFFLCVFKNHHHLKLETSHETCPSLKERHHREEMTIRNCFFFVKKNEKSFSHSFTIVSSLVECHFNFQVVTRILIFIRKMNLSFDFFLKRFMVFTTFVIWRGFLIIFNFFSSAFCDDFSCCNQIIVKSQFQWIFEGFFQRKMFSKKCHKL